MGNNIKRKITFILPTTPPSLNRYKVFPGWGSRLSSDLANEMIVYAHKAGWRKSWNIKYKKADILLYFPTKRKTDADNYAKTIFDGLVKAGLILDDNSKDFKGNIDVVTGTGKRETHITLSM